jgi:serine/threonine protein kinase
LKPDNVMVGAFGEVMVLDWGVAKALSGTEGAAGEPGTVLGTHGFMPPEQARGENHALDERADVYGLGVILLALLSNQDAPIADGASAASALARFPSIPRPLRSICARALAADPASRYPSAAALGEDVARYRSGAAVLAHRETPLERTVRIAKVYRTPILLVLAYMIMRTVVAFMTGR